MITSRANINPDLLIWARKTVGLDIEKSAKKISIKPDLLEQWESGEKKPTINQLRKIANLYKRSFAVFFLPNPPSIPSIPMDFRLLPENLNRELSYETLIDIRVSIRKREIALDLANSINRETEPSFSTATLKNDPEKLAQRERDFFKIDVQTQFNQKDKYAALRLWKNALEDKKILIFQSSRISSICLAAQL